MDKRKAVLSTPGVGTALIINSQAMPAPNSGLKKSINHKGKVRYQSFIQKEAQLMVGDPHPGKIKVPEQC